MNNLVIPPSPNWFQSSILACSPDNTLIYGSRQDLVVVKPTTGDVAADIRVIPYSHTQRVLSVAVNRNWGNPNKYCVTTSDDKVVRLWNISKYKLTASHINHVVHDEKLIGANFAGEEKVVSVAETGRIVIWQVNTKEETVIKDVFGPKAVVTCLAVCPHVSWLAGFGMKNGLLVIVDLRKSGRVLHKLRGHDKFVISLSWCPAPVNIFPRNTRNTVRNAEFPVKDTGETVSSAPEPVQSGTEEVKVDATEEMEHKEHAKDVSAFQDNETKTQVPVVTKTENSEQNNESEKCDHEKPSLVENEKETAPSMSQADESQGSEAESKSIMSSKENLVNTENAEEAKCDESKGDVTQEEMPNAKLQHPATEVSNVCDGEQPQESENTGKNNSLEVSSGEETSSNQTKDVNEANGKSSNLQDEKSNEGSQNDEAPVKKFIIEPVEEEARKEFLLASSGKEGNIYIWRAGTDGRMQTFFSAASGGKRSRNRASDKLWITVNWITPNWLLSSSVDGALLKWILPRPLDKDSKPLVIHNDHSGSLYSIAGPCKYYTGDGWDNDDEIAVWTTGHDRLLLNTGINSQRKNFAHYPTFGGSVSSLAASPITPTRLALGLSDGVIRVWELGQPHTVYIDMTCFYQKVYSKVTAVAWHSSKEFLLAYGTSEGRIGILDTSHPSKPPKLFMQLFKSAIHKLEWGPLADNDVENPGLYAIAEGKVVIFNEKSNEDPKEIAIPGKLFAYNFAWKPGYSKLLISMKSGELLIYTPDLKLSHTLYLHQKGFSNIVWHPYGKSGDIDSDSSVSWFAAIVPNDHNVYIYDLAKLSAGGDNIPQPDLTLEGHFDAINCLAWDYLQGDKLVAAGEGGVAQVWNTVTNTLIASYIEPYFESIWSIMWSPLDTDHVISCGKNSSLVIWNISERAPVDKEELKAKRKKHIQSVKSRANPILPKIEKSAPEPAKPKKQSKNILLPLHSLGQNTASKHCSNMRRLLKWKEDKKKNPETGIAPPDSEENEVDVLQLFGSKEQIHEVIAKNEEAHQKKKRSNLTVVSSLFKGDIAEHIKQAIEQKAVTPQMLTLAPMVSAKVWQEACYTYAEQLNDSPESDPVDTATYYLACHKVQEAITCLCNNDLYKEAYALAKCRFPEDDPLIVEVLSKWAKYAFFQGDFETSATCYIVLGEYEEAAKALFRRSDQTLEAAIQLAELTENKELEKAVRTRYELFKPLFEENKDLLPKSTVLLENTVDSPSESVSTECSEVKQNDEAESSCGATENIDQIENNRPDKKQMDEASDDIAGNITPKERKTSGDNNSLTGDNSGLSKNNINDEAEESDSKEEFLPQISNTGGHTSHQDVRGSTKKDADDSSGIESD